MFINYADHPDVMQTPPRKCRRLNLSLTVTHSPSNKMDCDITEDRIIELMRSPADSFDDILKSLGSSPVINSPHDCDLNNIKKSIDWMMNALLSSEATRTVDEVQSILHYLEMILNFEEAKKYFLLIDADIKLYEVFKNNSQFQVSILNIWWQLAFADHKEKFIAFWPFIKKNSITNAAKGIFLTLDNYIHLYTIRTYYADNSNIHRETRHLIASGMFGYVYKVALGSSEFALKVPKQNNSHYYASFFNEVSLHSKLHHQNIIQLRGFCLKMERLSCVLEFATDGTLAGVIKDNKITSSLAISFAFGIAQGLAYMHSLNIMHGDIKPQNILLMGQVIKLADFGCAADLNEKVRDEALFTATADYLAPEAFHIDFRFTLPRDIYAFGKVWDAMLGKSIVRTSVFSDPVITQKENSHSNIGQIKDIPEKITQLMLSCGSSFLARPTAKEAASILQTECR